MTGLSGWLDPFDLSGIAQTGITTTGTLISAKMAQDEARNSRDWQERMSSTAHQREVKDLRLAGLNPILSATGGNGSSTPAGAMALIPDFSEIGRSMNSARQTSNQTKQTGADVSYKSKQGLQAGAQTENIIASTANTNQDTQNKITQNKLTEAQTQQTQQDTALKGIQTQLAKKDLSWYDRKTLTDMQTKIISANASQAGAQAAQTSAKAGIINAGANVMNAKVNQTSTPLKLGVTLAEKMKIKGDEWNKTVKKRRATHALKSAKQLNDFHKRNRQFIQNLIQNL